MDSYEPPLVWLPPSGLSGTAPVHPITGGCKHEDGISEEVSVRGYETERPIGMPSGETTGESDPKN